ncbi:MAG TPA: hypothetical protein VGL13_13410 [Polyangiaceae bacterium]
MSRSRLSLYRLNRAGLGAFSDRLREVLTHNDRIGLSELLELGRDLSARVELAPRAVDLFLVPEDDPEGAPLFASLRRVGKQAALEPVWTSDSPSLEGRLSEYDVLRDEDDVAESIDRLLNAERLPWFLHPTGSSGGWLDDSERAALAERLAELAPSLPDEVSAFAAALASMDGDVMIHDGL